MTHLTLAEVLQELEEKTDIVSRDSCAVTSDSAGDTTSAVIEAQPVVETAPVIDADIKSIWNKTTKILKDSLDEQIFSAWIKPLVPSLVGDAQEYSTTSTEGLEVELSAPNKFYCDHVRRDYGDLISSTIAECTNIDKVELIFKVTERKKNSIANSVSVVNKILQDNNNVRSNKTHSNNPPDVSTQKSTSVARNGKSNTTPTRTSLGQTNLNPKYNFASFVVGACNQFGHAVSKGVAEKPGENYNPLFIYGGVGLGKTHLVNAIGNAAWRRRKSVLLVSSEVFVNELINALRSNKMYQFKQKFRSPDVLIIDDIQFIIGKERTQEELFHTFNSLYQKHCQIIMTADKLPQELTGLEERLRTRFACGLTVDLQVPDFETRVAILIKKSEADNISLSQEVARLLAEKIDTNVRELEGALNRLNAMSALNNTPLDIELAESALRTIVPNKSRELTIELIQKTVAGTYNISVRDLIGKRRTQSIALPRQIAMYLCRKLTTCSYPEIGELFGGRDHSTVVYANRSITTKKQKAGKLSGELQRIESKLLGN